MPVFFIKPMDGRPDFRLVLTFIWGDQCNCDTDGNSFNPASREWTELYSHNREIPTEVFDVSLYSQEPLLLQVESPHEWLAARVAYFLAVESQGLISEQPNDTFGSPESIRARMGEFDLEAAKERVRQSHFQGATVDDPYPNLRKRK
jgi:hypothetical protein